MKSIEKTANKHRLLELEHLLNQKNLELEIEAALERIRTRAMSMHKSEEIQEVANIVFKQLHVLGVSMSVSMILIIDKNLNGIDLWIANEAGNYAQRMHIPFIENPIFTRAIKAIKNHEEFISEIYGEEIARSFNEKMIELPDWQFISEERKEFLRSVPGYARSMALCKYTGIAIVNYLPKPFSDKENDVLKRFAKVFEQAYIRFFDLQKAEAQAREAEIQLALERVRAASMSMLKSIELHDVIKVISEQIIVLDIKFDHTTFIQFNDDNSIEVWVTTPEQPYPAQIHVPFIDHAFFKIQSKMTKMKSDFFAEVYDREEKNKFFRHFFKNTSARNIPKDRQNYVLQAPGMVRYTFQVSTIYFSTANYDCIPYTDEETNILSRFAKVFKQAYTRFLDLQNAETQAREAQIQLTLERVRARTMAMQHSEELSETSFLLAQQVRELGIKAWGCAFHIYADNKDGDYEWFSSEEGYLPLYKTPREKFFKRFYEKRQSGETLYVEEFKGKTCINHYKYLMTLPVVGQALKDMQDSGISLPTSQIDHVAYFNCGYLLFITYEPVPEAHEIFRRFAKEFEQTYSRFLDLQKAEAQAREAQIEAALEKVRSRTMGMQRSAELQDAAMLLFQQVELLGIPVFGCGFNIWDEDRKAATAWMVGKDRLQPPFKTSSSEDIFLRIYKSAKRGESLFVEEQGGEALKTHYAYMNSIPVFKEIGEKMAKAGQSFPTFQIIHCAYFSLGYLMFISYEPVSYAYDIFKRFAKAFEQTYVRFMDLQKAEAQAREAQIEAALERVRAKAMGMHSSNDLSITASMVFTELRKLGVNSIRSGVGLYSKESRKVQLYSAIPSATGDSLSLVGWVQLEKHPVLEKIYESWLKQEDYFPEMQGEELRSYYQLILTGLSVPMPEFKNDEKQFGHFITSSIGCLYAWSEEDFTEDQLKIFRRFASIIDLTFRRYLELQKAEANAKEAVKQASLDRVRGEIASMRTSEDLNRLTPIIWHELMVLEVPFFRCGVFIINDQSEKIDCYLSNPEGESLAAWHSDYDTTPLFEATVKAWKKQEVYRTEWNKKQFIEFSQILLDQGLVRDVKRYQAGKDAPEYLALQMIPFKQGMLYVGSSEKLGEEQVSLVKSVAEAFSVAYARYEDFRQLEEVKNQIEKTLNELRSTQSQLIHAEKMASLGELTAGIAHEIQNPLNFVNNFSEVNLELIEELEARSSKLKELVNDEEYKELINNLTDNLSKILHHGKRADGIVKGMLQHSRGSSDKKEMTDINALADEYLRLAFHGFRARDKSFNAKYETDFDESIEKINIIPQEIGRVLLNLVTNAFYAVTEKKKSLNPEGFKDLQGLENYEPLVSVSTKRNGNAVEICVKDNGPGIPDSIKEKIFQPFFTTKPAGSGTGLGLSLSYDIITKGHNGSIKVQSRESGPNAPPEYESGTEFIIELPL